MHKTFSSCCALLGVWALLSTAVLAQEGDAIGGPDSPAVAGQLIISEFRLIGPNGATDEFIEIYNASGASHTVAASDSSAGYGVAASDGVVRFTIPNGTVIPARGHYLGVNSTGYSLSSYAAADTTYTTDVPDDAGIAIFNTSNTSNFTLTTRLDAAGPSSEANTLYREGTGYPPLTPFLVEGSFFRLYDATGAPSDTNSNANDFTFADTDATNVGAGQRLGAPGPENLASPIQHNSSFSVTIIDPAQSSTAAPNRVRDFTSDPANNSTFGTLDIRRRFTNNTGAAVTRLRFRIVDLSTFPVSSGIADLRVRTSGAVTITLTNGSSVNMQSMTLEQPPAQPNGGGLNSTLSVGAVTLGTPLANGASVSVRFLFGVQQTGTFKFLVNVEAVP